MGIKWLGKSHRSPVSCKEISREQVANRLQSRCKQGFNELTMKARKNTTKEKIGERKETEGKNESKVETKLIK